MVNNTKHEKLSNLSLEDSKALILREIVKIQEEAASKSIQQDLMKGSSVCFQIQTV